MKVEGIPDSITHNHNVHTTVQVHLNDQTTENVQKILMTAGGVICTVYAFKYSAALLQRLVLLSW